MSLDALDWAFRFPVTGAHKAVLLALAHHADTSGRCYPSEVRLILYSGVKERALRYALRELEDMEAIKTNCSRGGRRASEYTLSLGLVAPASPPGSGSATRNRRRNGRAEGHEMPLNGHIGGHEMPLRDAVEGHEMPLNVSSGAPNAPLHPPPPEVRGASGAPEGGIKCPREGHLVPPNSNRKVIEGEEVSERATASRRPPARTPIPEDWQPNAESERYAAERGLPLAPTVRKFRNNYRSNRKVFPDWQARFRLWCDEDEKRIAERETRDDSRGNGMVKVIAEEGWVSARRNGHDREADAGAKVIQGIFGHA